MKKREKIPLDSPTFGLHSHVVGAYVERVSDELGWTLALPKSSYTTTSRLNVRPITKRYIVFP